MRKQLILAAVVALLAGLAAPSATSSRGLMVGIFDEQSTIGNPDWAFTQYDRLGVEALRVNLYWGGLSGVARKRRPAKAVNPDDPAYDWSMYDTMVKNSKAKGTSRSSSRSSGRRAGRTAARARRTVRPPGSIGPAELRLRGREALQRATFTSTPDAPPVAGRAPLAGLERAEQPRASCNPQFRSRGKARLRQSSARASTRSICNAICRGIHVDRAGRREESRVESQARAGTTAADGRARLGLADSPSFAA